MKITKLIIASVLICVGMLFSGEVYQAYINNFGNFCYMSVNIDEDTSSEEVLKHMEDTAKKYDLMIMYWDNDIKSSYKTVINIYGSSEVREYLSEEFYLNSGRYASVFLGECQVVYKSFLEVPKELIYSDGYGYRIIGNKNEALRLIKEINESCPAEYIDSSYDSKRESIIHMLIVWIGIIAVIIFINYYDIMRRKKENFVFMTMGVNNTIRMLKHSLLDALVYGVTFCLITICLYAVEGGVFCITASATCVILLIVINIIMHLLASKVSYKKDVAGVTNNNRVLSINYAYKIIATVTLLVMMATNVIEVVEYVELYSQGELYNNLKGYNHVWVGNPTSDDSMDRMAVNDAIYWTYAKEHNICQFEWYCIDADEPEFLKDGRIIMANSNMLWYIKQQIPELSGRSFDKGNYLIVPREYENSINDVLEWGIKRCVSGQAEVVYYDGNTKMSVQWNDEYNTLKNPVIVYTNLEYINNDTLESVIQTGTMIKPEMYYSKISEDEFRMLANRYGYTVGVCESVTERYQNKLTAATRVFVCNMSILIMTLIIQIAVIISLVKLEYDINRKELIIKKTLGVSVFRRFSKLYLTTIVVGFLCIVATMIAMDVRHMDYKLVACVSGVIMIFLELVFIHIMCLKNDRENIQRVLKNGF